MLVGFVAGWLAVDLRPDLRASLVPPSLFDEMARGQIGTGVQDAPFAAAFIIQNNIRVALICFAGGMLLGIPPRSSCSATAGCSEPSLRRSASAAMTSSSGR